MCIEVPATKSMYGKYYFADFCSGKLWEAIQINDTSWTVNEVHDGPANQYASFGQTNNGELYLLEIQSGKLKSIIGDCDVANYMTIDTRSPSCPGGNNGSVELDYTGQLNVNYLWADGTDDTLKNNLSAGTYMVTVTRGRCEEVIEIEVTDPMSVEPCVEGDTIVEICVDDTTVVNSCTAPSNYKYQWYKNGEISSPDDTLQSLVVTEGGVYQVQFVGPCNSLLSDPIEVLVLDRPQSCTPDEVEIFLCEDEEIELKACDTLTQGLHVSMVFK